MRKGIYPRADLLIRTPRRPTSLRITARRRFIRTCPPLLVATNTFMQPK